MRVVTANEAVWKSPGVGATDVASIMNCPAESGKLVLWAWAEITQKRELQELKSMRKVVLEQGSTEWLTWRDRGVGGSEVGAVMGANPYKSPMKQWEEKTKVIGEAAENKNMKWGRDQEPAARREYEDLFGWSVVPLCCLHDDHDHIRCSLDGIRSDEKLISEIKCPREPNHRKYLEIAKITDPLERQWQFGDRFNYYRYQVLYQLLITGAERCHFVSYFPEWRGSPSERLAVIELFPEPEEQDLLLQRVNEFWAFVEKREPPPRDWLIPCGRPPENLQLAA